MFRRLLTLISALRKSLKGRSARVLVALTLAGLALSVAIDLPSASAEDAPAEFDWVRQFGTSEK